MSNLCPRRPPQMNEIMFEVFSVKKTKKIPKHKQIEKEVSEMIRGIKQ